MFKTLKEDVRTVLERDPAAKSFLEVWLLYPGVRAIRSYRRANFYFRHKLYFLARFVSQRASRKTGIEIHPGATIGRRIFIDHGTGIVIGETTEIGDDVTLYQGVTLGGTGKDQGKRHPTLENGVMVGAGAKVLGPFTVGENSKIAANAVVLSAVPPNSTAVGVPSRIVSRDGVKINNFDQIHIPDPISLELCKMQMQIDELKKQINKDKKEEK